jgi:hypothetical protein
MIASTQELWVPKNNLNQRIIKNIVDELRDTADTDELAFALACATRQVIPHTKQIYRASQAERNQGANCFGLSEALGSLLTAHGIQSAITLGFAYGTQLHAGNAAAAGKKVIYPDVGNGDYFPAGTDSTEEQDALKELHREFLDEIAADPDNDHARYFWMDESGIQFCSATSTMREVDLPDGAADVHLLASVRVGIEALHAIGDLARYRTNGYTAEHGSEKYEQAWAEQLSSVPAFINVPQPNPSLAGV